MNKTLPPEIVFTGFRIATMADSKTVLRCCFSDELIQENSHGLIDNISIGVGDGQIRWLGFDGSCPEFDSTIRQVKGNGKILSPGLIDCHTHLVYGGNRASEWEMRLNGKSYEEIAREGGGILSTVRATRAASDDELFASASKRLKRLMSEGVTTVEIKSGYGLDTETELKMLRVGRELERHFPVSVETTFLGAHAVPPEFSGRPDDYVGLVCDEMIPQAKALCSAVDLFCESIAFDLDQSRKVLASAIDAGLNIKVHAEQLTHTGAAAMAAELGAISADHLEYLSADDCAVLKEYSTVATLLPGAFYCLKEKQLPPIEALRRSGVPIAIATDSNPGSSPVVSLLMMGNMACNLFGLTPEEAMLGITRNAALALGLGDRIGTIEPGKQADFAVWEVGSRAEIVYGIGHNPCVGAYKDGERTG